MSDLETFVKNKKNNEKQGYSIPPPLQDLLTQHGIPNLKPIQTAAIDHGLFSPHNLLVCSPSGSGKTLIGLLAIANHLIAHEGTALFIVPYRALANEKSTEFRNFFESHHHYIIVHPDKRIKMTASVSRKKVTYVSNASTNRTIAPEVAEIIKPAPIILI